MTERSEIILYVEKAYNMLRVAEHNYDAGFYASAVNRAYYAVFFAANALLATKGLTRNKHSGVLAAFRQYFVKSGQIEVEFSHVYERVMNDRHTGDYAVTESIDPEQAQTDFDDARRFVGRVESYLRQEGFL